MIKLWHGDCLELMSDISDESIDMVLTDPPYGTTGIACRKLNRKFIGIEIDEKYYQIAKNRIESIDTHETTEER